MVLKGNEDIHLPFYHSKGMTKINVVKALLKNILFSFNRFKIITL